MHLERLSDTTTLDVGPQNFKKLKFHRFKFKAVEMYVTPLPLFF